MWVFGFLFWLLSIAIFAFLYRPEWALFYQTAGTLLGAIPLLFTYRTIKPLQKNTVLLAVTLAGLVALHIISLILYSTTPSSAWYWIACEIIALGFFFTTATQSFRPISIINTLGYTAFLSLTCATTMTLIHTDFRFGFGQINHLLNAVGPILLAWGFWHAHKWIHRKQSFQLETLISIIGLLLLFITALYFKRRGILLAGLLSSAVFTLAFIRIRFPRFFLPCITLLICCAIAGAVWYTSSLSSIAHRSYRTQLYQGAVEAFFESNMLLGHGPFGFLNAWNTHTETILLIGSIDSFAYHPHNEILNELYNGGIVGLCLLCGALFLIVQRITIIDTQYRFWAIVLSISIMVHAQTSIIYGTHIGLFWLAIAIGGLYALPARTPKTYTIKVSPKLLALPLVSIALFASLSNWKNITAYAADTGIDEQIEALEQCSDISAAGNLYPTILQRLSETNDDEVRLHRKGRLFSAYVDLLGWQTNTYRVAANYYYSSQRYDLCGLAISEDLRKHPFSLNLYSLYISMLERKPQISMHIKPMILKRLQRIANHPQADTDNIHQSIHSIDDAADMMSSLICSLKRTGPSEDIQSGCIQLVEQYGFIPDIGGGFIMHVIADCGIQEVPLLRQHHKVIAEGLYLLPPIPSTMSNLATVIYETDEENFFFLVELFCEAFPGHLKDFCLGTTIHRPPQKYHWTSKDALIFYVFGLARSRANIYNKPETDPQVWLLK